MPAKIPSLPRLFSLTVIIALLLESAFAYSLCSVDQERVYSHETPYPRMMATASLATFTVAAGSWLLPNKQERQNPAWLVGDGFAWAVGAFAGPSCEDIPSAYIDGMQIAEERTALALSRSDHVRMLTKFATAHAVNLLVLSGVYLDTGSPGLKSATIAAFFSPLLGYGLFEWQKIKYKQRREEDVQRDFLREPMFSANLLPDAQDKGSSLQMTIGFSVQFQ
jgi:hypothetical protein